jgi:phenylalanyl-tRNA synthetase beta chain
MLNAATRMVLELCGSGGGGEASDIVSAGQEPRWQRQATLRFRRLAELGGLSVPADDAVCSLERLGFDVRSRDAERVTVSVPPWRNDIAPDGGLALAPQLPAAHADELIKAAQEVEAECDLIEEVLRLHGLDAVPPVSLPRLAAVPAVIATASQSRAALARRILAAAGLMECVTFSFLGHDPAALFGDDNAALRLLNPIASDLDQMRPSVVATLALAAARNQARGMPDMALFEIGPCFDASGQRLVAAGLRCGHTPRNVAEPARPFDALDAKGDVLAVLTALGVSPAALHVTTDAPGFYHPGQAGTVRQGPKLALASFGALHPGVLQKLGLTGPVVAFEIMLDAIPDIKRRRKAAPVLSELQPVRRDFAFLVQADVPADAVLSAVRGAERGLVTDVVLFDIYEGGSLPAGQKSVGVEVTFQPRDRSLTEAELESASENVVAAVAKATGGVLRG